MTYSCVILNFMKSRCTHERFCFNMFDVALSAISIHDFESSSLFSLPSMYLQLEGSLVVQELFAI